MSIRLIILSSVAVLVLSACSVTPATKTTSTPSAKTSNTNQASFNISVSDEFTENFEPRGRVFLFLSESDGEPRQQLWPLSTQPNHIFATNIANFPSQGKIELSSNSALISTASFDLSNIPDGQYTLQVLWDSNISESNINAPGNLYSEAKLIEVNKGFVENVVLSQQIAPRELVSHPLVKEVEIQSALLSEFWGRPYFVKASVLLPATYLENDQMTYPIRYNVAGYGGRYNRVNRLLDSEEFMLWWMSDEAPQIITVYLDGEGPFGDSYQLDSNNSGPFGSSLINELIPSVEQQFRAKGEAKYRFTDGCSTGGWVSLALQIFYPDSFNGAFSYSADAVDFSAYQLINIYEDSNAFVNEWNNLRPVARDLSGDPIVTMKDFVQVENVLGASNNYLLSGGQFGAHTALYSPKGEDGLPKPLFDPTTGEIDSEVAQAWQKYDLKMYAENNWETLGPNLHDKIYVWMGDMDNFFLNPAMRQFDTFLQEAQSPASNAVIEFEPMAGHCFAFGNTRVLKQIQRRLEQID
jgi:S-formylglutathione hydrolase FrmB